MDRPEVKRRVAISYIVTAICLIAILVGSQLLLSNQNQNQQDSDSPASDDGTVSDTPDTVISGESGDPETDDTPNEVLEAESCTFEEYRYRMITDETELASLGLPNVITDDMMGAVFATADDQVTLYAYPAYGCRAILIAGKDDAYSFCVLDGFTDNTSVQTLATILTMDAIYAVSNINSAQIISADGEAEALNSEELEQFYSLLSACTNAGEKAVVTDGVTIALTSHTGAVLELSYYEDVSLISALVEYYTVTDDLKTLIINILS